MTEYKISFKKEISRFMVNRIDNGISIINYFTERETERFKSDIFLDAFKKALFEDITICFKITDLILMEGQK